MPYSRRRKKNNRMKMVMKETEIQRIYVQIENKCATRKVGYYRSHSNSEKRFKEKFGSCIRKTFDGFTTKDSK